MMRLPLPLVLILCWPATGDEWRKLPAIPDEHGFAGAFAGTSGGALIVAGGANFPDKKPWEGGQKVWHDRVFVLDRPDGKWQIAGKLPRPLGYGVSVSDGRSTICVGGSDSTQHHADCFRLDWKDGKIAHSPMPALPRPLANMVGAIVGEWLYVVGGIERPDDIKASTSAYRLNLSDDRARWESIADLPGEGRMLAMAGSADGSLFVVGGVSLEAVDGKPRRKYLKDAYRFDARTGWSRVADAPGPIAAAPSPMPSDATSLYVLGGDDGSNVSTPPDKHPGFSNVVHRFDPRTGRWSVSGKLIAPRVTVPTVWWNDRWVVPSGELRPGVRSPEVWAFAPGVAK